MLSRVAESIYWMSRYIERAENVARVIDVNLNLMLDRPLGYEDQWDPLVNTTGDQEIFSKEYEGATRENVIQFLTLDASNPEFHPFLCSIRSRKRTLHPGSHLVRDVGASEPFLFDGQCRSRRGVEH